LPILDFESSGFTPTFNCYKKDNKIIVGIEAPGISDIESDISYAGEYCIININGKKKRINILMIIYIIKENLGISL